MKSISAQLLISFMQFFKQQMIQLFTPYTGLFLTYLQNLRYDLLIKADFFDFLLFPFIVTRSTQIKGSANARYGVSLFLECVDCCEPKFFFKSEP